MNLNRSGHQILRHCEAPTGPRGARPDDRLRAEAIQSVSGALDCFAPLAMTAILAGVAIHLIHHAQMSRTHERSWSECAAGWRDPQARAMRQAAIHAWSQ